MQTIRTFIAVDIPASLRKRAASLIERLKTSQADMKWVDTSNLHLTLKFLGDVPNTEVPAVCQAVAGACQLGDAFPVTIAGAGAFPDVDRARTVWIGVDQGTEQLIELHDRIDDALEALGYPPERRRFHPHLTIGRLRRGGRAQRELSRLIVENADFAVGATEIHEVVVYASSLDRSGPTYDVLAHVPFGVGDASSP